MTYWKREWVTLRRAERGVVKPFFGKIKQVDVPLFVGGVKKDGKV